MLSYVVFLGLKLEYYANLARASRSNTGTIHGAESYFAVASVLRTHYPEKKRDDDDDDDLIRRNDNGAGEENEEEEDDDDEDSKMIDIVSSVAIMPSKLKEPPNISITISSSDKRNLTVRVRSFNHFDVETEHARLRRVMSSDNSIVATTCGDDEDVFGSPPHSPSHETRSRSACCMRKWCLQVPGCFKLAE